VPRGEGSEEAENREAEKRNCHPDLRQANWVFCGRGASL